MSGSLVLGSRGVKPREARLVVPPCLNCLSSFNVCKAFCIGRDGEFAPELFDVLMQGDAQVAGEDYCLALSRQAMMSWSAFGFDPQETWLECPGCHFGRTL